MSRRITFAHCPTGRFMDWPAHPPGHWWVNVAKLGQKPRWEVQPFPQTKEKRNGL